MNDVEQITESIQNLSTRYEILKLFIVCVVYYVVFAIILNLTSWKCEYYDEEFNELIEDNLNPNKQYNQPITYFLSFIPMLIVFAIFIVFYI